jgi:hypothetical protein
MLTYLEKYYWKLPIIFDLLVFTLLASGYYLANLKFSDLLVISGERSVSTISDIITISLTLAGFILTLLTLLISFKSTKEGSIKDLSPETDSSFHIFFYSKLYFSSVKHLIIIVEELAFLALIGFILKVTVGASHLYVITYFNIAGMITIILALYRGLFILKAIIQMQKDS